MKAPFALIDMGQSLFRMAAGTAALQLPLERREDGRLTTACSENLKAKISAFVSANPPPALPRVVCAIPARGVMLRRFTLPASSSSKEELERVLLLQLEAELPLSPQELAWGYVTLPSRAQGQELLVAAVKKEVLESYTAVLTACGLQPIYTLASLARSFLVPPSQEPFSLLDLGRRTGELAAFDPAGPLSVRVFPWDTEEGGTSSLLPASQALASRLPQGLVSRRLYVTGDGSNVSDLSTSLTQALGGGILVSPLGAGADVSQVIAGLQKALASRGTPSLLLLQTGPELREQPQADSFPWRWAVAAALLLLAVLSLRYLEPVLQRSRVTQKMTEMKRYQTGLPSVERELAFLHHVKTNQAPYVGTLALLANALPPGVRIDSFSMQRKGDITFRGALQNPQQLAEFRSKLINSGFFSAVVVEEQTPTPDRQRIQVRMSAALKPLSERPAFVDPNTPPAPAAKKTAPPVQDS